MNKQKITNYLKRLKKEYVLITKENEQKKENIRAINKEIQIAEKLMYDLLKNKHVNLLQSIRIQQKILNLKTIVREIQQKIN
ncbi:hypothetical protein K9L97_00660 [Candidatus Woesearchaeota archaeon]|nr:hypothetical protein [Candidatus Woesearchaeota archaeon]